MKRARGLFAIAAVTFCVLLAAGCESRPASKDVMPQCSVDVCIIRVPPQALGEFLRCWSYADERDVPEETRMAWRLAGLRIGKVSPPFQRRIADVLAQTGAEVIPYSYEAIPSGHLIPITAGRFNPTAPDASDGDASPETLVFRVRPQRTHHRGLYVDITPSLVAGASVEDAEDVDSLAVRLHCASDHALLIGPAGENRRRLAASLESPTRKGWFQVFWVRVPSEQPPLD